MKSYNSIYNSFSDLFDNQFNPLGSEFFVQLRIILLSSNYDFRVKEVNIFFLIEHF